MTEQKDTDRLAGDLLKALKDVISKPLPGTASTQPKPEVDDKNLLATIKDFLNQSLPGTAPTSSSEKPAPTSSVGRPEVHAPIPSFQMKPQPSVSPSASSAPAAETAEEMLRRHTKERQDLYRRQEQELNAIGYKPPKPEKEPKTEREPKSRKMVDEGFKPDRERRKGRRKE